MVAGSTDLQEAFPHMTVNAVVGEQANAGANVIKKNKAKIAQSDAVLIGLGTNGTLTVGGVDYVAQIMKEVGYKPVYWINVHVPSRPWETPNNTQLSQEAKKYSNLKIIDWYGASKNNSSWFYSDGIHPYGEGAVQYTTLIMNSLAGKR
jgi:lysophospholipase L1-like esterase